ncbi:MAG TPA: hypothetical protein VN750_26005 [Steroidobacteraceae bacterium]|nr:hypothetical protein [Steroidobacteraceae bacterium]
MTADSRTSNPSGARGPCAKRQVVCIIQTMDGTQQFRGENDCANPQPVCPRLPGEGYEKCQSICEQAGHAEAEAVKAAGEHAKGARAQLWGHYWMCEPCGRALREAGVISVTIYPSE